MPRPSKALLNKWYDKLEKSGFVDVEPRGREDTLKTWTYADFSRYRKCGADFESHENYYQKAGQFLHSHHFSSPKEKAMWELHSGGHGYRQIETIMRKRRFNIYKDLIHRTIVKLKKEMFNDS